VIPDGTLVAVNEGVAVRSFYEGTVVETNRQGTKVDFGNRIWAYYREEELTLAIDVARIEPLHTGLILAVDPGITTGVALMQWPILRGWAQVKYQDPSEAAARIRRLIVKHQPETVVVEDYRVYPWKMRQHVWSPLNTVRLIGAIDLICKDLKVPIVLQGANKAKVITDERLKAWGLWKPGNPHAMDAVRHLVSYIILGKTKEIPHGSTHRKSGRNARAAKRRSAG